MTDILAIGDVHGHLQAALCVAARWQRELGIAWDAVLLAGDIGTFTDESQLDEATRRHGEKEVLEIGRASCRERVYVQV
jgi:predicted phosphodiesterase